MISFTQGDDGILLNMTATDGDGTLVDLTGATFVTQIKGPGADLVTIPNGQHTIKNQTTHRGEYTITLLTANTSASGVGDYKDIVSKIVIAGVTVYYHGNGIVRVQPAPPIV